MLYQLSYSPISFGNVAYYNDIGRVFKRRGEKHVKETPTKAFQGLKYGVFQLATGTFP